MKKISVLLFLATLFLYIWTLSPTVASQGDSGELVTVAYTLGIAHPPGYPLYTLLGHIFSLIPYGSVAWRLNLMAAVMDSIAVVFIFLILKKMTGSVVAALAGATALAVSYTFWLYSLIAEVFSLNNLIAAAIIYFLLEGRLVLVSFLFGLGMANNHTIILLTPAVLYWVFVKKVKITPKLVLFSGLAFLAGLLPYWYILIRAKTAVVPVAWSYPQNLKDLWELFIRADYGTFSPAKGSEPALVTLADKWRQIWTYLKFLFDDFGIAGLILAVLGMVFGFLKKKRETILILAGFFFSGVGFLTYANFPYHEASGTGLEIIERFYLLPNIFVALAIAFGVFGLAWVGRRKTILIWAVGVVVFAYTLSLFLTHYGSVDQKDNYLGLSMGRDILVEAAPGALVLPQGDVPTFVSMYARYGEGFRSDVEIVGSPKSEFRYLKKVRPDLDLEFPKAASMAGFIRANFDKAPMYFSTWPNLALPSEFVATPAGFLMKVQRRDKLESNAEWERKTEVSLAKASLLADIERFRDVRTAGDFAVQSFVAMMYGDLGVHCLETKQYDCAIRYFTLAHETDSLRVEPVVGLAQAYEKVENCEEAEKNFLLILELNPKMTQAYDSLTNLAKECFKDEGKAEFYSGKKAQSGSRGDLKTL